MVRDQKWGTEEIAERPSSDIAVPAEILRSIRQLIASISLESPNEQSTPAELKQYAWNSVICMAVEELCDELLSGKGPQERGKPSLEELARNAAIRPS